MTKKFTIALDLGGTRIKMGLLKSGEIVDRMEWHSDSIVGLKKQLPIIEKQIQEILQKNNLFFSDIQGLAISFAGLVDSSKNQIISTNQKYDDGPKVNLEAWAKDNWNWSVFVENDARMALLGEWQYGIGRGWDNIVLVTLGTGIGSAVLLEGHLLKGKHFQAGNLGGHFTVNFHGNLCTCGNKGCMEAEASTWRLPSLIKENPKFHDSLLKDTPLLDFKSLFACAKEGDSLANEVLEHCYSVWAAGIISMIHAFDPEIVILSGGIMRSASVIMPVLQERIDTFAWTPWGRVLLKEAEFANSAALLGGDYLVTSSIHY